MPTPLETIDSGAAPRWILLTAVATLALTLALVPFPATLEARRWIAAGALLITDYRHGLLSLLTMLLACLPLGEDISQQHLFDLGRKVAAICARLLHQRFVERQINRFFGSGFKTWHGSLPFMRIVCAQLTRSHAACAMRPAD